MVTIPSWGEDGAGGLGMGLVAGGESLGDRVVGRGRGPAGTPDGPGTTPAPPPAAAAAAAVLLPYVLLGGMSMPLGA